MSASIRKWLRRFLIVTANVAVLFVQLEIVGIAYYAIVTSGFFYLRPATVATVSVPGTFEARSSWRPQVHPYFAFNFLPANMPFWRGTYYNNHGFLQSEQRVRIEPQCCNFPSQRRDADDYFVAILGGSVAGAFALAAQSSDTLVAELKKSPKLAGKRIRVLSFASGGWKQPQQILVLAYYLSIGQPFDLVVNIDGFNEVGYPALVRELGWDVSAPGGSWLGLVPALEAAVGNQAGFPAIATLYYEYLRQDYLDAAQGCWLASCWLLSRVAAEYYSAKRANAETQSRAGPPSSEQWFFRIPTASNRPDVELSEIVARRWAEATLLLKDITRVRGIGYMHVLQPNRFYHRDRGYAPKDPQERIYQELIPSAYAALQAKMPELREKGVPVLDTAVIFAKSDPAVYDTDCCHLSGPGNELMMHVIGQALVPIVNGETMPAR